jgi:tetratricopeptide (TPR) repeat protein
MTNDDHTRPGDTVGNDKVGSDKTGRDKVGRDKTTIIHNYYGVTPPPTEPPPLAVPDRWLLAHPYADLPDFTGRAAELADLDAWLAAQAPAVLVVRALGGFGKSALTWHWLHHHVSREAWPRVVWWSFYDADSAFAQFVPRALEYLGADLAAFRNPREQVEALLEHLRQPGTLLMLDGFERALRGYSGLSAAYQGDEGGGYVEDAEQRRDCIDAQADFFIKSAASRPDLRGKILLTTRLRPRALEKHRGLLLKGCREHELTALSSDDALAYLRAAGIRGDDGDIRRVARSYGNHPLSLAILAGWLLEDLRQPGDIAAAQRLTITNDLVQNQHHVLEAAYQSLSLPRRVLLSRIACFRSAVTYDTLHAAAEQTDTAATLDADLRDLRARGLLQQHVEEGAPRFDLHPIVRRYAYERLGHEERQQAHTVLIVIFEAFSAPGRVQRIEELTPQIELYHHLLHAGRYDAAYELFYDRLNQALYFQFGAYDLQIDLLRGLFPDGEDQPPRLSKEGDQAEAISMLAVSYSMSGQPHRATRLLEREITLHERRNEKLYLAIGLGNLANRYTETGQFRAAEANLRRSIALCQELGDAFKEAVGHQQLGRLLAYAGRWQEAEDALATALHLFEQEQHIQMQGVTWAYRALLALLQSRAALSASSPPASSPPASSPPASSPPPSSPPALAHAQQALAFADKWQQQVGRPNARDYVEAHWLLGAAHLAGSDLPAAERHLGEALTRCRGINLVQFEPDILRELARLRLAQGNPAEAHTLAAAAQGISERSGYVLKEADARLVLARLAQQAGNAAEARQQAAAARRLATCDGPPDYTYYAAYVEAERVVGAG